MSNNKKPTVIKKQYTYSLFFQKGTGTTSTAVNFKRTQLNRNTGNSTETLIILS